MPIAIVLLPETLKALKCERGTYLRHETESVTNDWYDVMSPEWDLHCINAFYVCATAGATYAENYTI